MTTPTLTLMVGPPGCGKSTFTREAVEWGPVPADSVVCPDDWRERLTGNRAEQKANEYVFRVCDTITYTRLSYGLDVWIDATNVNAAYRAKFLKRCRAVRPDTSIILVPFVVSSDELLRRNWERAHPVPLDVLERMIAQMDAFEPDLGAHVVYPEELSLRPH